MGSQELCGFRMDAARLAVGCQARPGQQVLDPRIEIVHAVLQSRELEDQWTEPTIQVVEQLSGLHCLLWILVYAGANLDDRCILSLQALAQAFLKIARQGSRIIEINESPWRGAA